MIRIPKLLLTVLLLCTASALRAQSPFPNYPLPQRPDTLRILGVGNSFTDDGMEYLPDLLEAAGIRNVVLGRIYYPGCSLEQHCRFDEAGEANYIYYKSTGNAWRTVGTKTTLREAVGDERWDIVVLQQTSSHSGLYVSYQPWLDDLIRRVRTYCPNAGACLAWQMTWAYAADSTHGAFGRYDKNPGTMYAAIRDAVERLVADDYFDVVVPTGTAIELLRASERNNAPEDFTRDGYHLDFGCGRYTAACCWFQRLVAPVFRTTVVGNPFRPTHTEHTIVTDEAAECCQRAAQAACIQPFAAPKRAQ